jgi:translation initiation factor IF-1
VRVTAVEGKVVEALPHALYEIELSNGTKIVGHMAGIDSVRLAPIVPGDRVTVELSPYDPTKGRIVKKSR